MLSGINNASTSNSGSSGAPYHGSQPSSSSGRAGPAVPMPTGVGRPPPGPSAGSRPHSSLEASNRVPPLTEVKLKLFTGQSSLKIYICVSVA